MAGSCTADSDVVTSRAQSIRPCAALLHFEGEECRQVVVAMCVLSVSLGSCAALCSESAGVVLDAARHVHELDLPTAAVSCGGTGQPSAAYTQQAR